MEQIYTDEICVDPCSSLVFSLNSVHPRTVAVIVSGRLYGFGGAMDADRESKPGLAGHDGEIEADTRRPVDDAESVMLPTVDALRPGDRAFRLEEGTAVDGRYRIERVLGAGGMGAVYVATDLQLERQVALKMIRSDMAADRSVSGRFRREAVAVARLRHPHIVTVHDYGVAPDVGAYIVMELLEGHSLRRELVRQSPIELTLALEIARQVCQAVSAAHRAGVIHLDLKPENIVVESRGKSVAIKVVDFGLAQMEAVFRSDGDSLTVGEATFGTPAYMSPEQCRGESADARSDIYSLGCVVFELLTGRPPFLGRPATALMYKHINEPPPLPSELAPSLIPALDRAVLRALAKDPDHRFQTMEAFERALVAPEVEAVATTLDLEGETREPGVMTTVNGGWLESEPPNNLPQSTSRFFGRVAQIEEVQERLSDARLVTLVGPGGIGKTRLSLEVAGRARGDYAGGVWFVELAALADPSLVAPAVASAMGAREQPGRSATDTIAGWLRDRRVLLVLDNCEHVVDACARLADDLLRQCPALRVLASSREPLGVPGEAVVHVPALTVPGEAEAASPDAIARFEATRMFVERAALGRTGFAPNPQNVAGIIEVCRRLDGIPLAIELAAACVTTLSVSQIAAKLDDRFRLLTRGRRTAPRRQQTLRAAIDWSHDLLSDDERTLLRRLSVFAGGFTYEAAEHVSGLDVLDSLERLVDTSFVLAEERSDGSLRYRTFETVREYAAEKLKEAGEENDTRDRHCAWFLSIAEQSEPHQTGPRQSECIAGLELEHDNLRAALRWSAETADTETGLRLCYALGRFWSVRGHLKEGRDWLERVLSAEGHRTSRYRPRVLLWAAQLSRLDGDRVHARTRLEQSEAVATELGDTYGLAAVANERFNQEFSNGNLDGAERAAGESMWRFESEGDRRGVGMALTSLASVRCQRGDLEQGAELFERGLALQREIGDLRSLSTTLSNLGRLVAMKGDYARSRDLLAEGLAMSTELGDRTVVAFCHNSIGIVAMEAGEFEEAIDHFTMALKVCRELNSFQPAGELLESLACVAVKRGSAERAAVLIGAGAAIREITGTPLPPADLPEVEASLNAAREAIGADAVESAMADGRAMSLDEAVDYALADPITLNSKRIDGPA